MIRTKKNLLIVLTLAVALWGSGISAAVAAQCQITGYDMPVLSGYDTAMKNFIQVHGYL